MQLQADFVWAIRSGLPIRKMIRSGAQGQTLWLGTGQRKSMQKDELAKSNMNLTPGQKVV